MAQKVEQLFIMVADQRDSGFVQEGTENTPNPIQLRNPSVLWVPSEGYMAELDEKGVRRNVKVRYIKNCDIIDPKKQDELGFKPNNIEDKIKIEKGYATISKEYSDIGLFNYLSVVYYNGSAPNRPATAQKLFDVVRLDKTATEFNEEDVLRADAIKLVSSMQTKVKDKEYIYNEERINAVCAINNIYAETPAQQIFALMQFAKAQPLLFLERTTKFEQTIVTEVSHAIMLKVITFEGNSAQYMETKKVITTFGAGKMSDDLKAEKLSDFLKTKEGNAALTELRANIEVAKNKELSQS